jgi:hypothetical protein
MANLGWRARISFFLAGAIFVLSQMVAGVPRDAGNEPVFKLAGDRSVQASSVRGVPFGTGRIETEGRAAAAD